MLETLEAQFGVTQSMLQGVIVIGLMAVFIGTYWRLIVAGLSLLFVIYVFTYDRNEVSAHSPEKVEIVAKQIPPTRTTQETAEKNVRDEFLEDCMTIAANEREQCEEIWKETEPVNESSDP